uniref:Nucleotide pyrophosphatase/phosphodiesterase 5 Spirometra erinaceieuropaei n=1 Tax=Spirometra erinaceieuropaei TaxID=99802 RepID=K7X0U5_SPIER|nr:nucleotide pyrophosphatase/phosphodiesterase 5 Spirometra erinaceieuropaei [Spirometra erinaceieuropaei]
MFQILTCLLLLLQFCCGNKVILISLDGFRHDYIEKAIAANRNVSAFLKLTEQGFRAKKVQSVMLSLTFPSHFSLATGRYTETHGLVGNTFYDKATNDIYQYTNATKNMQSKWFTMNGNEPIWLTNQRHGGKTGMVYWPGSEARYNDQMQYVSFGLYSGVPTLRFRVDRIMEWITQPDVNFCMLYFNQPDSAGHSNGPDSTEVLDAIELTNDGIAYLMQRIEQEHFPEGKRNIIVTSDHGMTAVSHTKIVNVSAVLSTSDYKFGVDGSPANLGIWVNDNGTPSVDEIYTRLKTNLKHATIYKKADIPESYHYRNNPRVPDIVVVADLGWMIQSDPTDPYKESLRGMHGYNNSESDMHPFLVAAGPGIKPIGMVDNFHQIDVYPFVCLLLKLYKPNRIDGDVRRVLPFLTELPSLATLDEFERYAKGLTPTSAGMTTGGNGITYLFLAALALLRHMLSKM